MDFLFNYSSTEVILLALAAISFSMTGGAGDFAYTFARYEQAPSDVQEKEIAARASKITSVEE